MADATPNQRRQMSRLSQALAPRPKKAERALEELRADFERAELERDSARIARLAAEEKLARLAEAAAASAQKLSEEQQKLMARVYHVVTGKLKVSLHMPHACLTHCAALSRSAHRRPTCMPHCTPAPAVPLTVHRCPVHSP